MAYKCTKCGKIFKQKSHLNDHLKRKNPCDKILKDVSSIDNDIEINKVIESLNNNECHYCGKKFNRKSNLHRHIKESCSGLKDKSWKIKQLYVELQTQKNKYECMNKEINRLKIIEIENKLLKEKINKLEVKVSTYEGGSSDNIINGNNNIGCNNTNIINNNIVIVAHGREDKNRVYQTDKEIIFMLKKGWQSPRYSICKTHFNRKFPEYNNIYLPDTKNKHIIVYNGKKYVMRETNEVISEIYDQHVEYIEEKFKELGHKIPDSKKKALMELFNLLSGAKTDIEKQIIADRLFENIKLLLFNNRDIAINTRRILYM